MPQNIIIINKGPKNCYFVEYVTHIVRQYLTQLTWNMAAKTVNCRAATNCATYC